MLDLKLVSVETLTSIDTCTMMRMVISTCIATHEITRENCRVTRLALLVHLVRVQRAYVANRAVQELLISKKQEMLALQVLGAGVATGALTNLSRTGCGCGCCRL